MIRESSRIKRLFKLLGPGLITSVADDDPTSIATCAIAGASLGLATLWWVTVRLPLTAALQSICARIGLRSGYGLTEVLSHYYPKSIVYPLVFAVAATNVITLGADIGAIADAIAIFTGRPVTWVVVPIAAGLIVLQIFKSYESVMRIFKWLALALVAYIFDAAITRPPAMELFKATFIPSLSFEKHYITTVVAIIGTFLTPYVFFWQTDSEVEERKTGGLKKVSDRAGAGETELRYNAKDIIIGAAFSTLISYMIVLATAMTLHVHGQTQIDTGAQAAKALAPLVGKAAGLVFALGIIGTGLITVPILSSSTAFMFAQLRRWPNGLDEKWSNAKRFYWVIIGSTLLGTALNFIGINPITALYWASVIAGIVAPVLLILIMLIARNRHVTNDKPPSRVTMSLGWIATGLTVAAVVGLIFTAF